MDSVGRIDMEDTLLKLNRQLNALSVFRSILDTHVVSGLQKLLYAIEEGSLDQQLSCYGAFSRALYEHGGNLTEFIKQFITEDENFFLIKKLNGDMISPSIYECLYEELAVLQKLSSITPHEITEQINYSGFLPQWDTHKIDIRKEYEKALVFLPVSGCGIFAKYRAFKVKSGELIPIKKPDSQTIESLYGYAQERSQVLENTRALAKGHRAANVLLYGDAGTGKSSTVKACAAAFADKGVRLIEFNKAQLEEIPVVIDALCGNPLKFIFYIDDLSFSQNDDSFCHLKGILEGNVTSYSDNIVIYATSNRRHLIKESMAERIGSDLHLNDTLQETMSLASRFGLTVTFSKPEKELYLKIVKSLADEYGVVMDETQLFRKAEAFAIRANGRSPRIAKQFIQLISIGIKQ